MRKQGLEQEENQNGQRIAWYQVARNTFQHFCIRQIFFELSTRCLTQSEAVDRTQSKPESIFSLGLGFLGKKKDF